MRQRYWIPTMWWSFCGKGGHITPLCLLASKQKAERYGSDCGFQTRPLVCDVSDRNYEYVASLVNGTRPPWHQEIYGKAKLTSYSIAYCTIKDDVLMGVFASKREAQYRVGEGTQMHRFRTTAQVTHTVLLGLSQEVTSVEEWRK